MTRRDDDKMSTSDHDQLDKFGTRLEARFTKRLHARVVRGGAVSDVDRATTGTDHMTEK